MTNKLEMYKCNICGNMVQVLATGIGELVCCGQNMELLVPQNSDADKELTEKHTPEIEKTENTVTIKITKHPMIDEHFIMLLQAYNDNEVYTKFFSPHENVEMKINNSKIESAVSYCNIHNLYKS